MSWSTVPALPPSAPTADTDEAAFDSLFQHQRQGAVLPRRRARPEDRRPRRRIDHQRLNDGRELRPARLGAYGASRAAIELLTKAWAAEYGPQNVRVNAVAPGPTLTPAVEPRLAMAEEFAKQIPLGRVADVHELSDVITFLATPAAGYINGAIIPVDGGRTAV